MIQTWCAFFLHSYSCMRKRGDKWVSKDKKFMISSNENELINFLNWWPLKGETHEKEAMSCSTFYISKTHPDMLCHSSRALSLVGETLHNNLHSFNQKGIHNFFSYPYSANDYLSSMNHLQRTLQRWNKRNEKFRENWYCWDYCWLHFLPRSSPSSLPWLFPCSSCSSPWQC